MAAIAACQPERQASFPDRLEIGFIVFRVDRLPEFVFLQPALWRGVVTTGGVMLDDKTIRCFTLAFRQRYDQVFEGDDCQKSRAFDRGHWLPIWDQMGRGNSLPLPDKAH